MKKLALALLFAAPLAAQVQIGKGVQIGGASGGGSGTVTSISVAGYPSFLGTVVVTSPTTVPLFTFTAPSYNQNFFLAGPTSGSGTPTVRAIVPADIPTLNQNTTGQAGTVASIAGLVNGDGTTVTRTGSGTSGSPYIFSSAGGGGLSGQTSGCAPKANSGTTANAPMPICTDGTTTTITQPVSAPGFTSTGTNAGGGTAGGIALGQGTPGSAIANSVEHVGPATVSTAYTLADPGAPPSGTQYESCSGSTNVTCTWTTAGGGGGTSNPVTCTSNSTGIICAALAPYYVSGSGALSTTTSGTTAPGTSVTLAASGCTTAGFDSGTAGAQYGHQGISIAGAGAAGAIYTGTITSCTGTALVVTPATSTSVAGGAVVSHDESAAINAMFTATAHGRNDIYLPCGTILASGPLLDTSGANAVLKVPTIVSYSETPTMIGMHGCAPFDSAATYQTANGTVIQTAVNSGNLIGGYDVTTSTYAPFTNVWLTLDNLYFLLPVNPGIVAVNSRYILQLQANHDWCGAAGSTFPTTTTGGCFFYPSLSDTPAELGLDLIATGVYTGFIFGEHAQIRHAQVSGTVNGFEFDTGTNSTIPSNESNAISMDYAWCGSSTNCVATGAIGATINIQNLDVESSTNVVNDSSNLLTGIVNYRVNPISTSAFVGGAHLSFYNLSQPFIGFGGTPGVNGSGGSTQTLGFYANSFTPNASISNPVAGEMQFNAGLGAGASFRFQTTTTPAVAVVHTTCTTSGCYDDQNIGDSPNWLQMFYFPSTWGFASFLNPVSAGVINVDTGGVGGLVLNAAATGATVRIGTQSALRATFASTGLSLPAGETYTGDTTLSRSASFYCINSSSATCPDGSTTPTLGTGGIDINTSLQQIGGTFGRGGSIQLQANTPGDSTQGGFIFAGGSTMGTANQSEVALLSGTSFVGGLQVDGDFTGHHQGNVGVGYALGSVIPSLFSVNGPMLAANVTDSALTSGNCLQASTAGLIQDTGAPCYPASLKSDRYWDIQSALFATSTLFGPVYFYQLPAGTYVPTTTPLIARLSGTISCTVAPVVGIYDLGTSSTTAFGSATLVGSVTTGTSDGVYQANLSSLTFNGQHYYGVAFSAGTCVTAPTIDVTVQF